MIIARAPLRITLGGGGTDLPSYYREHGGFLVAGAIDRYVHVAVSHRLEPGILLRHAEVEHAQGVRALKHPILREALTLLDLGEEPLEITTFADVPAGTGLGSSGSFTVALLSALHALRGEAPGWQTLAEEASHIEMDILAQPVGRQDPCIAAHGGITAFNFARNDTIGACPLTLSAETRAGLVSGMVLFFTGITRHAASVLQNQDRRSRAGDATMISNLHQVKAIGEQSRILLETGDLPGFATLMHEQWMLKRQRGATTNPRLDSWYNLARTHGAVGGKLIGAGGGGFLMFWTKDPDRLRHGMAATGLQPIPFGMADRGAETLCR